jgi:hypothetical protein
MAKLRTQNDGATANHLTPAERAAIGGYRAGGTDPAHYRREYDVLHRAYSLPTVTSYTAANGERCYDFGPSDGTPHPGTAPRVFERLTELVELLQNSPAVAHQKALF